MTMIDATGTIFQKIGRPAQFLRLRPADLMHLQLETLAALDEELDDPRWVTQRQIDEARVIAHNIAEHVTQVYLDSVTIEDREPGYERRIRAALEMIRARHERLSDETLFLQP